MTALVTFQPKHEVGALLPVQPVGSVDEIYARLRKARANLDAAGRRQVKKEQEQEAQEQEEERLESLRRMFNTAASHRIYWKGGWVLYKQPIGPQQSYLSIYQYKQARHIAEEMAMKYKVQVDALLSASRSRPLIPARRELCYVLFEAKGWSMPRIGYFIDRDHTSVLHAIRCHVDATGAPRPARMGEWKQGQMLERCRNYDRKKAKTA